LSYTRARPINYHAGMPASTALRRLQAANAAIVPARFGRMGS